MAEPLYNYKIYIDLSKFISMIFLYSCGTFCLKKVPISMFPFDKVHKFGHNIT